MEFIAVANVNDIPVGRMRAYIVGDRKIAIYHTERGFSASDNVCPHRGGPLAEGDLIGEEVICPWHLWGFDAATGLCTGNASIGLTMHEVKVDGERILIHLSPPRVSAELV